MLPVKDNQTTWWNNGKSLEEGLIFKCCGWPQFTCLLLSGQGQLCGVSLKRRYIIVHLQLPLCHNPVICAWTLPCIFSLNILLRHSPSISSRQFPVILLPD